jgi:HSP20 family protein
MATRPYPFEEMERMMEQMMEQMRRAMYEGRIGLPAFGAESDGINLSLDAVDDGYVVVADMPGFEKEEIDLRYDDGSLSVEASREVSEEDGVSARHHTRHVYERIHVPGEVVEEEISASYRNGVLEVRLPVPASTESEDEDDGTRIDTD